MAAVSVLLPFHNAATTLGECLDSIQAQTLGDFELLAVDDWSSDSSNALVHQRAIGDRRVRLLRNPGRGLVDALNFGLSAARAPLIARMDADDRMRPRRLALQCHYLRQHPQVVVVGAQVRLFPSQRILLPPGYIMLTSMVSYMVQSSS